MTSYTVSFKAICVRQQLLGDDHEELLVSIEKYVPALSMEARLSLTAQLLSCIASCSASLHGMLFGAVARGSGWGVGAAEECLPLTRAAMGSTAHQRELSSAPFASVRVVNFLCYAAAVRPEPRMEFH